MSPRRSSGFTIVETLFSMLVVSLMLGAAVHVAAFSKVSQAAAARRASGHALAEALMAELISLPYKDPADVPPVTPSGNSPRTGFNDIDDYRGLDEDTPRLPDGTAIPKMSGWTRHVEVHWVAAANLEQVSGTETGYKRIHVTVKYLTKPIVTRTALRTPVL